MIVNKPFRVLNSESLNNSNQSIRINKHEAGGECSAVRDGKMCVDDKSAYIIGKTLGINSSEPEKILNESKKKLSCETQQCVMEKVEPKLSGEEKEHIRTAIKAFFKIRSRGISTSLKLLSNVDIDKFLEQLVAYSAIIYDDPKYLYHECFQMEPCIFGDSYHGPTEMGKRNLVDIIKQNYKCYCVVLNTDKCTGGGIHWFCVFCDFRTRPFTIEYFNSSGNSPMLRVQRWMVIQNNNINEYREKNKNPYRSKLIIHRGLVHQTDSNSECGPYSLLYIMNRVKKVPAMAFKDSKITDAHATQAIRPGYVD